MGIKESETPGLSETERAALEGDDTEQETLEEIAGEGDDDGDDTVEGAGDDADEEGGEEGDDGADDDAAKPDDKPASKPDADEKPDETQAAADTPVEVQDDDEEDVATLPTLSVDLPKDADEQLKTLKASKRTLFKEYNDGKIDDATYEQKLEETDDKIDQLNKAIRTAEMNEQIQAANEAKMTSAWQGKVSRFIDEVKKAEGVDYKGNTALGAALDAVVKDLGNKKDGKGNLVHGDKPMGWFLREAHRQVKASFGLITVPKTEGKPAASEGKPAERKPKAPDTSKVPPAIARVPAAAEQDDGGEFGHLSNLTGMALERAVAKLTPDQQARWAEQD